MRVTILTFYCCSYLACVPICLYAHVSTCMWKVDVTVECLQPLSTWTWNSKLAGWLASKPRDPVVSVSLGLGLQVCGATPSFFIWFWCSNPGPLAWILKGFTAGPNPQCFALVFGWSQTQQLCSPLTSLVLGLQAWVVAAFPMKSVSREIFLVLPQIVSIPLGPTIMRCEKF